jgi:enoyl-CoA hydratase/carnithine racemase
MPEPNPLSPTDILVDRSDPAVVVVTINRPERRNAMKLAMWKELARIFTSLSSDSDVRAVVLTGAGSGFCAGADISEFSAVRATVEDGRAYEAAADDCQSSIASCVKPTIAAISGPCYGGGVGIALSCDFRVADASAYFGIPAARLSNVYGVVETRAVFEAVGVAAAKEILFTGRRYDLDEAYRIGLATHMANDDALSCARNLAASMAVLAPLTIKGAKIVIEALARGEVAQQQGAIHDVMDEAMASNDYKEGVAAFAEKRDPVFTGR